MPEDVESIEPLAPHRMTEDEWDALIKSIILFIEQFANIKLYPYQTPIVYSIVQSVVRRLGDHKTLIAARQSGKSELMAATIAGLMVILPILAKVYPELRNKEGTDFSKGFWVGVFAPTEEQADTIYNRIVKFLTSEHAVSILMDPNIDDQVTSGGTRGKGKIVSMKKCGSLCRMQTCNPKAKIEGRTYHFIFVDEAQGATETMITKSITPMLVSTRGSMVMGGTAIREKCYFYNAIQHNKRQDAELAGRRGRVRRSLHHEYDWHLAAKYNPNYQAAIDDAKERIGEDSDDFRMSYCPVVDTPILLSDLTYARAGDIRSGMRVVGFNEDSPGRWMHRRFVDAEVISAEELTMECSEVQLSDGRVITCTPDHKWLVLTAGRRTVWKRTDEMVPTDMLHRVCETWGAQTDSYAVGYLAAAFDGEGCLSAVKGTIRQLTFAQRDNAMLAEVQRCLELLGFTYKVYLGDKNNDCFTLHLRGGRSELMRFLGTVRPHRLMAKFNVDELGTIGRHARDDVYVHPMVVSVTPVGPRQVMAIHTSSHTFIADGVASHNCNEWILEKGMFVSPQRLDSLYDQSQDLVLEYWDTPIVVGIDVARSNDSTVATAVFVDWNNPDGLGFYKHYVLDWLEITDMEWESQYFKIIDFLKKYRVWKVGVDSQGVGGAVAERLALLLPRYFGGIEVVSVPSDSKSQHERWVHLTQLIQRDQLQVPGSTKARERRRWKKFHQQMGDLQRLQRGPYMLAAAPEERGAFDDYPDSLAIACSLSIAQSSDNTVTATSNPFYSR